jgi:hypothetical protein
MPETVPGDWDSDITIRYSAIWYVGSRTTRSQLHVDCNRASDNCGDPDCIVCLHRNSLVATYDDLPGWMFVLTEVTGGCEVVVFDRERQRRLEAQGGDLNTLLGDLRIRAAELSRPSGQKESGALPASRA